MKYETSIHSNRSGANRAPRRLSARVFAASAAVLLPCLFAGSVRAQDYVSPDEAADTPLALENEMPPAKLPQVPQVPELSLLAPESGGFAALLSGQNTPLSLKLDDLKSGWRRMTLNAPPQKEATPQPFSRRNHIDFDREWLDLIGASPNVYFTRGQTVSSGGDPFLAVYRVRFSRAEMDALFPRGTTPTQERITQMLTGFMRQRPLDLSLINLKTVSNLSDIRPFDIETQSAALKTLIARVTKEMEPMQAAARGASSLSNLKQIGLGLAQYASDHDEVLPPMTSAATAKKVLMPYVKNAALFVQPGANTPYLSNPILSKKKLAHIADTSRMIAFYEAKPAADGLRAVVFLDGHARRLNEKEWQLFKRGSKIK